MATDYGFSIDRARARVVVDSSNLGGATPQSDKKLALIGSAQGGDPNVVHRFSSYNQASRVLRGGNLLDAIGMAWNPSGEEPGASEIFVVRVEDATAASLTQSGLTIKSKLFGSDANNIQVAFEENPSTDSARFRIVSTKDRYDRTYNHIGNIFNVSYTGDDAQATITVEKNAEGTQAAKLILQTGADTDTMQTVREYPLGEGAFEDANIVADDINNLSDFEASMSTLGNKNIESAKLDAMDAVDIANGPATVKAVLGDLQNQVTADPFVDIEIDLATGVPEFFPLTNLEGGGEGTVPPSWASKIEMLANTEAYYIVPLTEKEEIHAEVAQFVADESNNGHHIRAVVGGGIAETPENIRSRRNSLASPRVVLTGASGTRSLPGGRSYNFPAFMFAAQIAGMLSGMELGRPMTFKSVTIDKLDTYYDSQQLDEFDKMGVVMPEYVRNRSRTFFRLMNDTTTYNDKTDYARNKNGLGEITDFMTTELRSVLEADYIGDRVQAASAAVLKNAIQSFLDQKIRDGSIVTYDEEDVQVQLNGDRAEISFACQPGLGLEYIDVSITYQNPQQEA